MFDDFLIDVNACNHFIEHQKFLAMKAKKRATERNKLPEINWSDEVEANSLSASKLKLYLKGTRFARQRRESSTSSSCSRYMLGKLQVEKTRMSSHLAVPKTKKIMNNQTIRKLTIMKSKLSRCSSSLTTQWNALQYGE